MMELGGHAIYLKPCEIHLGVRESVYDTVQVLSRMCDGIMARADALVTMQEIARSSSVPVINGMTTYSHPTQGLCDVFTMNVSTADIFSSATIGSANALHRQDIGRLTPGEKADMEAALPQQDYAGRTIDELNPLAFPIEQL
jgi:ornithine carbamoyltransferase